MVFRNQDLMPNFPQEGLGPTGVPMGQPVPGKRKKKMAGVPYNFPFPTVVPGD